MYVPDERERSAVVEYRFLCGRGEVTTAVCMVNRYHLARVRSARALAGPRNLAQAFARFRMAVNRWGQNRNTPAVRPGRSGDEKRVTRTVERDRRGVLMSLLQRGGLFKSHGR